MTADKTLHQACTEPGVPSLILGISPYREDHADFNNIFTTADWRTAHHTTCREALPLLGFASIVLCEEKLPDGSWKDVLGWLDSLPKPPVLIVTSTLADARLWGEVLNLGGYDLLARPLRIAELVSVVESAKRWCGRAREDAVPRPVQVSQRHSVICGRGAA
jgi:DNA-binding response OmpR family regulator